MRTSPTTSASRTTGSWRSTPGSRTSTSARSAPTGTGMSKSGGSRSSEPSEWGGGFGHRPIGMEVLRVRAYIIRRLLYAIPTLIGISILVFAITRLSPGDPIRLYTFGALNVTEEDIQ